MIQSNNKYKVVIIGLGPAGLGAALTLSKSSLSSEVLCIEQGKSSNQRVCTVLQNSACMHEQPCQAISGFGGSALLSGGKISLYPAGTGLTNIVGNARLIENKLIQATKILKTYLPMKESRRSKKDIARSKDYFNKLGFEYKYYKVFQFNPDDLKKAYLAISSDLQASGICVSTSTRVISVKHENNCFRLEIVSGNQHSDILTDCLVIGVGRSGQQILKQLNSTLNLNAKVGQLDVGVRLEFPTRLLPPLAWYHRDLKLLFNEARTYCVCKNGRVVPYIVDGVCYVDGDLTPANGNRNSNLGIVIRLKDSLKNETILEEIRQRSLKSRKGKIVSQNLLPYLGITPIATNTVIPNGNTYFSGNQGTIDDCFPHEISVAIKKSIAYFVNRLIPGDKFEAVNLFAPEVNYSGISFPVKPDFSISPGIYIIGESTGQFRGIAQSLCSGIICAENIISD